MRYNTDRTLLTDGSGRWFDEANATSFEEDTNFDGNNHISVNTRSQWVHEQLYVTDSGMWILNRWSQWQGSRETYLGISEDEAMDWLNQNSIDIDDLPESAQSAYRKRQSALEL